MNDRRKVEMINVSLFKNMSCLNKKIILLICSYLHHHVPTRLIMIKTLLSLSCSLFLLLLLLLLQHFVQH